MISTQSLKSIKLPRIGEPLLAPRKVALFSFYLYARLYRPSVYRVEGTDSKVNRLDPSLHKNTTSQIPLCPFSKKKKKKKILFVGLSPWFLAGSERCADAGHIWRPRAARPLPRLGRPPRSSCGAALILCRQATRRS
jgi:hypothetical protein